MGKDRVVMDQRTAVVLTGDVRSAQHSDHAGLAPQQFEIDADQLAMGDRRQAQRRMQRSLRFGNIVGVEGLATDVQMRGFMLAVDSNLAAMLCCYCSRLHHARLLLKSAASQTLT